MTPGKRDKYITIEQPTYSVSTNTNNKYVSAWSTYKTVWAQKIHKQSQEVFESGQMVAKDTIEWNIIYYDAPAIKMDMRINYDSEYYYLVGIREIERKRGYILTTVRRDN